MSLNRRKVEFRAEDNSEQLQQVLMRLRNCKFRDWVSASEEERLRARSSESDHNVAPLRHFGWPGDGVLAGSLESKA